MSSTGTVVGQETQASESATLRDQMVDLGIAETFFESSVLFDLLRMRIFERVGDGDKNINDLASELGTRPEILARLLNAGVLSKLLETQDSLYYQLTRMSRSVLLPTAGECYLGDWIRNLDYLRSALSRLDEAVLKSGPTIDPASHLGADQVHTREFILAWHNYAAFRGKELASYLDVSQSTSLLDLGCGSGTYAFHLGLCNPELSPYLLDLPGVLEVAREIQGRYPLRNQVHYLPADVLKDEIPGSYDVILVSNMLHMLGEQASRELITRLFRSVNRGGSLVIQAQFLRDDRLGDRWPMMVDLCQLCITPSGKNHSVEETRRWLEEAGFSPIHFHRMSRFNTNSFQRAYKN